MTWSGHIKANHSHLNPAGKDTAMWVHLFRFIGAFCAFILFG
jgi:hypothetical protein